MTTIARIRRYPNWRTPRPKSVSGWRALSRAAIAPNAVRRPVSTTRTFAVPLWTEAPRKTAFVRAERAASGFTIPGCFSTGNDSPVMLASLTRKSAASITRPSAGIRLPAESRMRSPGTTVLDGHGPLDAVAHDAASQRQAAFQLFDRRRRAVFLKEAEQRASEHDRQNDGRIHPLLQHQRDRSGEDEDEDERALELPQKQTKRAQM